MISTTDSTPFTADSSVGLINVGAEIEAKLQAKRRDLVRSRYEVQGVWSARFSDLLRLSGAVDLGEYEARSTPYIRMDRPAHYVFREVRPSDRMDMRRLRDKECPRALYLGGCAADVVLMLSEHARHIRFLLECHQKIVFFGDAGASTESHFGLLTHKEGKFYLERLPVHYTIVSQGDLLLLLERATK